MTRVFFFLLKFRLITKSHSITINYLTQKSFIVHKLVKTVIILIKNNKTIIFKKKMSFMWKQSWVLFSSHK
jgi:hypothetical protein